MISRGVISVVLAVAGAGVWSLVIGYSVGTTAWTITLWHRVAWRPRFRPSRRHLRSLLTFGGTLTGIGVMAAFLTQFDNLVVGRVLGHRPARVLLDGHPPTLSVHPGFRGRRGPGAVPGLCLARGRRHGARLPAGGAFKGRGRSDIILTLSVPQAAALIIDSLAGIAIAAQLVAIVIAPRMFDLTVRTVLGAIRPPVLASAGLAIVLVVVQHAISAPWPAIIAGVGGGAVVYLGLLILLAPDTLSRLKTMAIPRPARPEFKLEMIQSAVHPLDEASPNGT